MKNYETVIGLEVHVELATKKKNKDLLRLLHSIRRRTKYTYMSCLHRTARLTSCFKQAGCRVCSGSRDLLSPTAVLLHSTAKFDRKNYFYPDNPQNYQISQLYIQSAATVQWR